MSSLAHHGVKGQKWGVRRFQNPDGTRTQAGKRRDLETRRTRRAAKSKAIVDSIIASMNADDLDLLNVGDDGYLSVEQGKYIAKRILVKDNKGEYVSFVDLLEDGNGLNGIVGTKSGDNYRGKGYATKAAKEALDWYDKNADKYGYTKLTVGAKKRNDKSQGLAEKSNFDKVSSDDDWVVYEHQSPKQKQFDDATKQVLSKTSTNVKSITKEPADIHGVMNRAGCSEKDARTCIKLADRIYEKAVSVEPQITQDIIGIVNNSNSSMYGLEHRLKQPTSMAGKIGSDSKSDGVSFVEAANGIKDAVRYTTISDNKSFVSDYRQLKSGLEIKGYEEVKCKNFFEKYRAGEVQHKAVQTTFKSPIGYEFELQFQTPESQAAKDLKIPIYEERRKQGISSSRAKELEKQMHDLAERVPYPDGIETIESHNKLKHSSIGGNMNYIYGNTLVLGDSSYLKHHGIKGQKWGVRRYQNLDGTRTDRGKKQAKLRRLQRNTSEDFISIRKTLSDDDLRMLNYSDKAIKYMRKNGSLNKDPITSATAHRVIQKDKNGTPVTYIEGTGFTSNSLLTGKATVRIISIDLATRSGEEYRGKGHAVAAGKKMVKWFDRYGYKEYEYMEWAAKEKNIASQKTAEKIGFKKLEGIAQPGWTLYAYAKHSSIGGNMNYIYGNTLVLGDSSYLEHHGIKNQKWGVRRFQNPDGSLTAAGRIRYGVQGVQKVTANVGKAVFNVGKTAGSKVATSAKKAIAAKKEKDLAAKKEKASRNRDSVLKNKDLFTSQELAELEKRFKVEDDMKFASMRKGQEIARTISTYGDAAVKVLNAAQTGGKAVSAISAAMGSMDQLKENRDIRGKAAAEDMSFEDYKAYTKAKTEAKINKDFKNKNSTSSDDDDHDIPVVPVDYDDNPPPGGPGGGPGGGPRTPTGGGPGGADQNRVHRLTGDQQKKLVSFRTKKPKRDEDDIGDVSEDDVNKYKKASKDADSKAKSAQQNADDLKSKRDQLDSAIRNFKLPPLNDPNYDAAAAQLRAAHKQSSDLQAAYKKAQSEADSARVAAYNAKREALASEYGGSKGKQIANDMAKKLSDKEYQHAVNAIDNQRESDKSGYDRNVAKAYLKDALNPKNIANRTIDKAAGKIADKAINKQKEALAKERDKQQKQMAENFQRSMKAGTLDASKGIRDYYQREFGLHGAQLDKAVNNYMDSHSGKGSKRTIDLSSYHDKRSSELAKKSASLLNREAAVSEREAVAGQREENIRAARQTLKAASDYLKGASEKVYNDSTIKEEQLHEINEHIRKMMGKRVAVHSEDNMLIENNTLIIGDTSSYLQHHGILGQKWGIRRFQNKDGTRTAAGKKRERRKQLRSKG